MTDNNDDKNVDKCIQDRAIKNIEKAIKQFQNFNGTPEQRLDFAEALIANLTQNLTSLSKTVTDLSASLILMLKAMENLGGRVKAMEKLINSAVPPTPPLPLKDAN